MEIKTNTDGAKLTITVSGRVDTVTAPELEAGLKFGDATEVVLDLADVPYMSSAGLRLLLTSHKTMSLASSGLLSMYLTLHHQGSLVSGRQIGSGIVGSGVYYGIQRK